MRKDKDQTNQTPQAGSEQNTSGTQGRSYTGSHAINRRVRLDRIAVVVVPLVLIIVLISSLCLYSCDSFPASLQNDSSNATPVTQLEIDQSQAEDSAEPEDPASTDGSASTSDPGATDNTTATTTDATTPTEAVDVAGSEITVSGDEVSQGNLIVINADHVYSFPEDDLELQYVYEHLNGVYTVSDHGVQLDAETLTQLNAMTSDFSAETGHNNLHIFAGYRTTEDQDSRYENGTSPFVGGCSDYHSGRTFNIRLDFEDGTTDYYNADRYPEYSWIAEHAAEYGFIQRYPSDKEAITGDDGRGYTFRYVGIPHATYIAQQQICLEEYVALLQEHTVDDPLEITVDDAVYRVYYTPAETVGTTTVPVPDADYTISGDNIGGFIVTYLAE